MEKIKILITGIGAGSLGLEIAKSLNYAKGYELIGTDISDKAIGFYKKYFYKTYLLKNLPDLEYADQLLEIALKNSVNVVVPGSGITHKILSDNRTMFNNKGILLMLNSKKVVDLCSDKLKSLKFLENNGIKVPLTVEVGSDFHGLNSFNKFPCIVKPSKSSGGSNLVFIAEDLDEAKFFVEYLNKRGYISILQEYIDSTEEFTVGILSSPEGEIFGSVALKRFLEAKLSVSLKYNDRVISSGWSQGEVDEYENVVNQAENIAKVLKSKWALNVQGRLGNDGIFYPFEINPRHSGTTYLRALAGFNEPDIILKYCLRNIRPKRQLIRRGLYLRAFDEQYISRQDLRTHD